MAVAVEPALIQGMTRDRANLLQQLCRQDLLAFTRTMYPEYIVARHHIRIANKLQDVADGKVDRLIITMPPRHGKSELASIHFPVWYLANHPDHRIIACSNTADLANKFSRSARNKVSDPRWPFPDISIASDLGQVQRWDLQTYRGGYIAAGVGGSITGFGGNGILVDDPVKSAAEADSPTYRDSVWEWYQGTLRTRLEPGGFIIVIGTRWHEDDMIGRLMASGEPWDVLHLEAIDDDGNALWPERFGVTELERLRREIGSRNFEAQYQGRPVPLEGGILKAHWFNRYTMPQDHYYSLVQAWDTAFKAGEANDYTACVTLGLGIHGIDVLDVFKARLEYPDLERSLETQHMVWTSRYPGVPMTVLVEDKGSGQSLIQSLRRKPYSTIAVIAEPASRPNEKQQRVHEISPSIEAGRVRLPVQAEWLDETLHELITFPASRHDDVTDAFAIAVRRAVGIGQSNAIASDQSVFASKAESQQARQRRVRRLQR